MIPEHVAAFAAGLITGCPEQGALAAIKASWVIEKIGLGIYPPTELRKAALDWLGRHVDDATIEQARARLLAGRARAS